MTDRLRVGIDITPLVGPPTGIHQHTRHLSDALAKRDDVTISGWLLSARGPMPAFPGPTRRAPLPARVAATTWRFSPGPNRRHLAGDVDVVHGTNFLGPPDPTTVLTIQDLTPLNDPERVAPAVAAKAPAIRHAIDAGAWMHVSSERVGHELSEVTGSDRIRVIHHALPDPISTDPGAGCRLIGHDRYVAVVGATEPRKRVDRVIDAVARHDRDLALAIVGPAGAAESDIERAVAAAGLHDRVVRRRDLNDRERSAVVADAVALALASDYEGFGLTPLEALRVGVPVAATAVGALPELIGDRVVLGAADGGDFDDRLDAAIGATVPVDLIDRLAALTWSRHAEQMRELYASAAAS
ncbi:MAG: glycosyltransferase [Actinomycetota bacterium]